MRNWLRQRWFLLRKLRLKARLRPHLQNEQLEDRLRWAKVQQLTMREVCLLRVWRLKTRQRELKRSWISASPSLPTSEEDMIDLMLK